MWSLIVESGFGAWTTLFLTVAGAAAAVTVGRKRGRPGSVAAAWAVAVLASGAIGYSSGQRMVDRGIRNIPQAENRVAMLSIGTREAAANLLLAGFGAMALCSLGGVMSLVVRPKEGAAT